MKIFYGTTTALALTLAGSQPLLAQVQGQWTATGFMQSARELDGQVALSNGNALAIGGIDNSGNVLASAEIYTGAKGAWAFTGSLHAGRYYAPSVVLADGTVLVAGGVGVGNSVLGSAELFNPSTGSWTVVGSLTVARFGQSATLLPNGTVLVAGGCTVSDCSATTATSEIYNPATQAWTGSGSLGLARSFQNAVLLNSGLVLAVGGNAGGATASCELFDPASGTWGGAATAKQPRYQSAMSLLPDGKVLVSGGVVTKYPMNSAELYDPAANSWTLTGTMSTGRYAHTSTLLSDGTVLAAGGIGQAISCGKDCVGYIPTADVDVFNEATLSFTPAASLNRALAYQATTLLTGGQALTAGGEGYTATCCVVVPDAEYYTPLSLSFSALSLNFGFLQVGLTSPPQYVTVTNVSNHAVDFTGIVSSGDYAQSNTCPSTLTPGQFCTVTVTFTPKGAGARGGAVTLSDDSPGSPQQVIALSGTGEKLALGFSPAVLNFGIVTVGSYSTLAATLINDGASSVNITGISIAKAKRTWSQTNTCPAALSVQQSCTIMVTFRPPDVFKYKATLSVSNSAGAAATLPLAGMGSD